MSKWLEFGVLGYLESFDGSEGFEIRDRDWKLGDLIARDLWDLEAESITAHKSTLLMSLSSTKELGTMEAIFLDLSSFSVEVEKATKHR